MEVITRAAAKAAGLKRYFNDIPCKNGHVCERYVSNKKCAECEKEKLRKKYDLVRKPRVPRTEEQIKQARERRLMLQRERLAEARKANPDAFKEKNAEYYAQNKEYLNAKAAEWVENNKEKRNEYRRIERKNNTIAAIKHRVSARIRTALRKIGSAKNCKTQEILGCSLAEFRAHLELQFLPGMSWDNRHLWHIDHIVALASAKNEDDVIALNHFTNLRPMWKPDNLKKGAKQTHLI